ncbi:hypothetical protein TNCV_4203771 [Trichonephila clavipes]|nr:hypothetical protein TNCV_4203771 [Trichonephila clavipes]
MCPGKFPCGSMMRFDDDIARFFFSTCGFDTEPINQCQCIHWVLGAGTQGPGRALIIRTFDLLVPRGPEDLLHPGPEMSLNWHCH